MVKPTMIKTRMDNAEELELKNLEKLRRLEHEFLDFVFSLGNSRALSHAKTNIELAAMWTRRHITER